MNLIIFATFVLYTSMPTEDAEKKSEVITPIGYISESKTLVVLASDWPNVKKEVRWYTSGEMTRSVGVNDATMYYVEGKEHYALLCVDSQNDERKLGFRLTLLNQDLEVVKERVVFSADGPMQLHDDWGYEIFSLRDGFAIQSSDLTGPGLVVSRDLMVVRDYAPTVSGNLLSQLRKSDNGSGSTQAKLVRALAKESGWELQVSGVCENLVVSEISMRDQSGLTVDFSDLYALDDQEISRSLARQYHLLPSETGVGKQISRFYLEAGKDQTRLWYCLAVDMMPNNKRISPLEIQCQLCSGVDTAEEKLCPLLRLFDRENEHEIPLTLLDAFCTDNHCKITGVVDATSITNKSGQVFQVLLRGLRNGRREYFCLIVPIDCSGSEIHSVCVSENELHLKFDKKSGIFDMNDKSTFYFDGEKWREFSQ